VPTRRRRPPPGGLVATQRPCNVHRR